jgi:hypothetical protein
MIKIPQNAKFSQTNTGDLTGNIYQTKNINFDTEGVIKLSKRTRNLFNSETYTDLVTSAGQSIQKIFYAGQSTQNRIYVLGADSLYQIKSDTTNPYNITLAKNTEVGSPTTTNFFDMEQFYANGVSESGYFVFVTNGTQTLKALATTTSDWGSTTLSIYGAFVAYFKNKQSLAIAGGLISSVYNRVLLLDATFTEGTSLVLPFEFSITGMDWNNNKLYIATQSNFLKNTIAFEWDGASSEANISYPTYSSKVFAVKAYKDGAVMVTDSGEVLYINGRSERLAQFPIYKTEKQWNSINYTYNFSQRLQREGITVDGDLIYFNVDSNYTDEQNDGTSDVFENDFPSGVWCYDPKVGLYHKYSVGNAMSLRTNPITTANVDTSTNIITVAGVTVPATGTPVFYDDGSKGIGTLAIPLKLNTRYFTIKLSDTTLKLATTYSNANIGTAIDITATGNNNQTLVFCPNNDFGGISETPSVIYKYVQNLEALPNESFADKFLIGSKTYKNNNSTLVVNIGAVVANQENRGYYITPKIQSQGIKDTWQKLYLKFNPLVNEDDKIIIKYRTTKPKLSLRKRYSNSSNGTWSNGTTFTTTNFSEASVGNEIEIIRGAGAGYLAHITNIEVDNGIYTVNIDETVQNVVGGDVFSYTVDNWTKLKEINTTYEENADGFAEINLGDKKTKWIQFKIELRGIDITVEEFQLLQETFKK